MNAIRTVSETEDVHVIEGYGPAFGGPFRGRDSYHTFASTRTNFHWDLFPDDMTEPRFVRPLNFQHGFDPDVGLTRVGGWSPVRTTDKGVWIRAQLDKHHAYYGAIRELLGNDALAFSPESAEHAVRIDEKTGEWLDWPAIAMALTPTPSNPWSAIAARTAETLRIVERASGIRATDSSGKAVGPSEGGKARDEIPAEDYAGKDKSFPIVTPASVSAAASSIGRAGPENYSTDELKANIIKIAKRKGADFVAELPKAWQDGARTALRSASDDVACATAVQSQLAYLMDREDDEADQLALLRTAFEAVGQFVTAEAAEIGTPEDEATEAADMPLAYMSAVRAGKRNAAADQALIDRIHDDATSLGASAHASDTPNDESNQEPAPDGAARSGGAVPAILRIVEPADPVAVRAATDARATEIGERIARERLRR